DKSQGFLIANHVLEHASNPFQVLINWGRILTDGGILFVTIPLAGKSFDKGRSLTSLAHFLNDYSLCLTGRHDEFAQLNRAHYREWLSFSEPCIMAERGLVSCRLSEEDTVKRIEEMAESSTEIHFHTFSIPSFAEFLQYFVANIDRNFQVLEIRKSRGGGECVAVLRRLCA
ncbi:MAG TPA: class I SAM-dependent methyltransferase, partial [Geomobilimonas sp.]|nr:class I SAM-dependent methyltransferase [Geomobilimonas sp.]